MFGIFVFIMFSVALTSAGISRHAAPEQQVQTHSLQVQEGFDTSSYTGADLNIHYEEPAAIGKNKGSSGAELTSLAHNSAVQANNAVRNQHTAGSQAAFGIKSTLANAAVGAAQTAQAALVGRQALVQNLKRQLAEAQHQLQEEITQYHQLESVSKASAQSSQDAHSLLNSVNVALAIAQAGASHAEQTAAEAANAAASQHAMVEEAKQNVAQILSQLQSSTNDLQRTELSALKAAEAAQIAQSNAAAAGFAVAAAGAKGGHSTGSSTGYSSGSSAGYHY